MIGQFRAAPPRERSSFAIGQRARLWLVAMLSLAPAASADAQTIPVGDGSEDATVEPEAHAARLHYEQGTVFYRAHRYEEAAVEFEEAYRGLPRPIILYSLGQSLEGAMRLPRAIETYRRFLEEAPEDEPRRGEVLERIAQLERLLATVRIESSTPADIWVDGERVGQTPGEVRLAMGRREFELRAEGYQTERRTVILAAGATMELSFELQEAAIRETTTVRVEVERRNPLPPTVFWAGVGVTAASATTWIALSGTAIRRRRAYEERSVGTARERNDVDRANLRADVLLGVTGALGISTALIAIWTDWGDDDESSDGGAPSSTPEVALRPGAALGPQGGMVVLDGSF